MDTCTGSGTGNGKQQYPSESLTHLRTAVMWEVHICRERTASQGRDKLNNMYLWIKNWSRPSYGYCLRYVQHVTMCVLTEDGEGGHRGRAIWIKHVLCDWALWILVSVASWVGALSLEHRLRASTEQLATYYRYIDVTFVLCVMIVNLRTHFSNC